ncbi:MAG: glycosyltransferase family 9 protein [Bacteroidetes bacterium]|nr:glycosyltransferase family 9 protein [Bacteroidota bacterium]
MQKILIIRFSSIGDIVLTSPVIRCIKKQLPDAVMHFLTKASFAQILLNNPFVDKVISFESDLQTVIEELKMENYDFVVDLHHNLRSFRVKTALGKSSASFNKLNFEKWLLVNLKVNRLPKTHIVDRYFETIKQLNVFYDGAGLDFYIPKKDEIDLNTLPDPWCRGYIAFVIGAKHFTKKMPDHLIIDCINHMKLPVVLLGGKDDSKSGNLIAEKSGKYAYNACGKFNLSQSASLVRQARLLITHDTGLMHIAAAKQQRIISLWGNTVPDFGMYPFLPDHSGKSVMIQNTTISCRPCSKIGFDECPKKHFKCMNDLNINNIISVAKEWWST